MTDISTQTHTPWQSVGLVQALPFWMSMLFVPMMIAACLWGGWFIAVIPIYGWIVMSVLDRFVGVDQRNIDPNTTVSLTPYRLITLIWLPIQAALIFGPLMVVSWTDHLSFSERVWLMVVAGVTSGSIGINYAHELVHQRNRAEQRLGEGLLALVLYGHFKSEHVLVHHRYVGTPRDPVTARYNEHFYRFFARVVWGQLRSAWEVEASLLARRGLPIWHRRNPFWRYVGAGVAMLVLAWLIGGAWAVMLFCLQAFVAILQLELVNYVEHYGLTRRHLGGGKYEPVAPRHSWNAAQKMTNYLLINLQRHSDHHFKPDRRFPLLQTYPADEAPQLPYGYPVMTLMALNPLWFRRTMNPLVRKWRMDHYPDIKDWSAYKSGALPMPR
ncbi:MAG: alkane 1-monooxygenase [Pseudomonadota bacterium]